MQMQAALHAVDKLNALWEFKKNEVLKCHVDNLPIRQNIKENFSLALAFHLTFIANTSVLFHSLFSQPDLNRGQPPVRSGREVWKDEHGNEGDKNRQSALDVK